MFKNHHEVIKFCKENEIEEDEGEIELKVKENMKSTKQ